MFSSSKFVVNCFQNCIFTYDSQHLIVFYNFRIGCELLSKLYFYLWFPTYTHERTRSIELWIAFKIVFLLMIPNLETTVRANADVVNCFQNCIFTYDSQPSAIKSIATNSCELLSKLYFYLWFPTYRQLLRVLDLLWIAFKIVFLLMIPN